jgi:hypothetical protein
MQVVEVVEFIIRELQLLVGVQVEEEQEIREVEVTTLLQAVLILEVAEVLQDGFQVQLLQEQMVEVGL